MKRDILGGLGLVVALTTGCGGLAAVVPPVKQPLYTENNLMHLVIEEHVDAYGWMICLPIDQDAFSTTGTAQRALWDVYGLGGQMFFDNRAGAGSYNVGPQPMLRAREGVHPGDRVCYQPPQLAHEPPPPTPTPQPRCHSVQAGDTAWSIKEAFYARDGVGGRFYFDNRAGVDANSLGEQPATIGALEHVDAGDTICYDPPQHTRATTAENDT
jgi:hypothetical protein